MVHRIICKLFALACLVNIVLGGKANFLHELPRNACTDSTLPTSDPSLIRDYICIGTGPGCISTMWKYTRLRGCSADITFFEYGPNTTYDDSVTVPLGTGSFLNPDGSIRPGFNPNADMNFRSGTLEDTLVPNNNTAAMPRAGSLSGSDSHNAMVWFYPGDYALQLWASLTDDPSLGPVAMRAYFKEIENSTYYGPLDPTNHGTNGPISVVRVGTPQYPYNDSGTAAFMKIAHDRFGIPYSGVNGNGDYNGNQSYRRGIGYWQRTVFDSDRSPLAGGQDYLTVKGVAGTRSHAGNTMLPEILSQCGSRVNVKLNSYVERIIMDGTRAIGVVYVEAGPGQLHSASPNFNKGVAQNAVRKIMYARRGIIVGGGTLMSPPLLERSGIGRADILTDIGVPLVKELQGVGEGLQDHMEVDMQFYQTVPPMSQWGNFSVPWLWEAPRFAGCNLTANPWTDPCFYPQWLTTGTGIYSHNFIPTGIIDWSDPIIGKQYDPYGDCHIHFINGASAGNWDHSTFANPWAASSYIELNMGEARGSVHSRTNNSWDTPIIRPGYATNQRDVWRLTQCARKFRNVMLHPDWQNLYGFTPIVEGPNTAAVITDDDWKAFISRNAFGHHFASTLKMGSPSDPMAVLDSHNRPFGTQNLYVVDHSSVPVLGDGNPKSQVFMVGARAGAYLAYLETRSGGNGAVCSMSPCNPADDMWIGRSPQQNTQCSYLVNITTTSQSLASFGTPLLVSQPIVTAAPNSSSVQQHHHDGDSSSDHSVVVIVLAVLLAIAIIVIIAMYIYYRRQGKKSKKSKSSRY